MAKWKFFFFLLCINFSCFVWYSHTYVLCKFCNWDEVRYCWMRFCGGAAFVSDCFTFVWTFNKRDKLFFVFVWIFGENCLLTSQWVDFLPFSSHSGPKLCFLCHSESASCFSPQWVKFFLFNSPWVQTCYFPVTVSPHLDFHHSGSNFFAFLSHSGSKSCFFPSRKLHENRWFSRLLSKKP